MIRSTRPYCYEGDYSKPGCGGCFHSLLRARARYDACNRREARFLRIRGRVYRMYRALSNRMGMPRTMAAITQELRIDTELAIRMIRDARKNSHNV